jgi:hypothetical protein
MRFLRIASFFSLVALCVTPVWAQYGLYGSPEVLRMPQAAYAPAGPQAVYAPSAPQYGRPYVQTAAADRAAAMPAEPAEPRTPSLFEPAPGGRAGVPPPPQSSSGVNQMLSDPSSNGARGSCEGCYRGAVAQYGRAAQGAECGDACGEAGCCPWYATVGALVMGRDNANKLWTTFQTDHNPLQLTNTQDIHMPWQWGGEIRFGRRFCDHCGGQWALEASYWTLTPSTGFVSTLPLNMAPFTVSTPLHTSDVQFYGISATNWFNGAAEQRLWRRNEFHNVEISLLRNRMLCGWDSPWTIDWSLGARFFRFEEELSFASLQNGCVWGQDRGIHEVYLNDQIANNLWGFQFGFNANYYLTHNLRLYATPKFGVYNNHIDHFFRLNLGDGTVATTGSSGVPGTYPVWSNANALSFLTQIDLGVDWLFAEKWSARVGYRVMAATGIGLAENQIPPYLVDIPAIADIDTNGHLILHGAYVGLTYNY